MNRKDYVYCIGYDGGTAIIDRKAQAKLGNLDTAGLLEKGLFRYAASSAEYSQNESEQTAVVTVYNEKTGSSLKEFNAIRRVFGLNPAPKGSIRIKLIG